MAKKANKSTAQNPSGDIETACRIVGRTAIALLKISQAAAADRWPHKDLGAVLVEAIDEQATVDRVAMSWIPPLAISLCGVHGTTTHEVVMLLAARIVRANNSAFVPPPLAVLKNEGWTPPSPRQVFGELEGFPYGAVRSRLEVERRQALAAAALTDTKTDDEKKSKQKRRPNKAAVECAELLRKMRKQDPETTLKDAVNQYVSENPEESEEGLYRRLTDNPHLYQQPPSTDT